MTTKAGIGVTNYGHAGGVHTGHTATEAITAGAINYSDADRWREGCCPKRDGFQISSRDSAV